VCGQKIFLLQNSETSQYFLCLRFFQLFAHKILVSIACLPSRKAGFLNMSKLPKFCRANIISCICRNDGCCGKADILGVAGCADILLKLVFKPTFFCCNSNMNGAKHGSLQFQSN
jgi:hypothetical protein